MPPRITLRAQVYEMACRHVNKAWAESAAIGRIIDSLCVKAFIERWPEGNDTVVLRTAYRLLQEGAISQSEPGVFYVNQD